MPEEILTSTSYHNPAPERLILVSSSIPEAPVQLPDIADLVNHLPHTLPLLFLTKGEEETGNPLNAIPGSTKAERLTLMIARLRVSRGAEVSHPLFDVEAIAAPFMHMRKTLIPVMMSSSMVIWDRALTAEKAGERQGRHHRRCLVMVVGAMQGRGMKTRTGDIGDLSQGIKVGQRQGQGEDQQG